MSFDEGRNIKEWDERVCGYCNAIVTFIDRFWRRSSDGNTVCAGNSGGQHVPRAVDDPPVDDSFVKGVDVQHIADVQPDNVNHPQHYKGNPAGIECIQVVEHMNFNLGNAIKYLWRADKKGDRIHDLRKAAWYINREIERIQKFEEPVYQRFDATTDTYYCTHHGCIGHKTPDVLCVGDNP
jgi:Protein of unknwon function (DUF3310)